MPKVEISERLYRYLQSHAVPLEDSVESVLNRLLEEAAQQPSPALLEGSAALKGRGQAVLKPLLEAGLISPGDEIQWRRGKKGVTYNAWITDDGCIKLPGGGIELTPSGAATTLAGGNHPGWDVWRHLASGHTLAHLRSLMPPRAPEEATIPSRAEAWQRRVIEVMKRLPAGRWVAIGDLAHVVGQNPRPVGAFLRTTATDNGHRVLLTNGRFPDGFRWVGEDRGKPEDVLRREGVHLTPGGMADASQRIGTEELQRLLTEEQEPTLNVSELAEALGVDNTSINRWVRNGNIIASTRDSCGPRFNLSEVKKRLKPD